MKQKVDWAAIRRDFEAGSMSNRELAAWYSISEGAIRKKAKGEGWVKKSTQPEARTESRQIVVVETPVTPETTTPEAIVGRGYNLTLRLLDELETTTTKLGELDAIIDLVVDTGTEAGQKAKEAIQQATSLKQRSQVLKDLALAHKTLRESVSAAPGGKKEERQRSAEKVGQTGSKFAPPAPPRTPATH